jgi:uncharacterized protein YdeI (BOF family)
MQRRAHAATFAVLLSFGFAGPALAQAPGGASGLDNEIEPPGYEDFKDGDLSRQEVEELEERRDDRNIVSPGMRDEQELDWEMDRDGN